MPQRASRPTNSPCTFCRDVLVFFFLVRSVMVSAKFFDDIYYDNNYYAKVPSPEL